MLTTNLQKSANTRKGGATINVKQVVVSKITFFLNRKYHKLIELFTHFSVMYNMLLIFTCKQHNLPRNLVTRFSRLQVFLIFFLLRNIFLTNPWELILTFFFIRRSERFSRNCRNRFSKYVIVCEIYEICWGRHKQFSQFSN